MTTDKPYEVTICVFRREVYGIDDRLLGVAALQFETLKEAIAWADKIGVVFK